MTTIINLRNEGGKWPGRSGSALVVVLASLAFLAALALAFLASVGTELKSSKRYADGVSSQLLAQTAFNLAQTQISEATKGVDGSGNTLAWASQPGMIRTYDTSGAASSYYKLYSSDVMKGTGAYNPYAASEALPLAGTGAWYNKPGLYTDLNQPLKVSGGNVFPIIDGNGIKSLTKTPSNTNTGAYWSYDADGNGLPDIDGFGVDPAKVSYNSGAAMSSTNTPVPMPVKWLYVLQDGEIVTATATANANEAARVEGAAQSPIVGRIAFWTDDETCKLNINTASEGTYTDMARVNYIAAPDNTLPHCEQYLASRQPVNSEFQRYPGHPAMVSLSTVIKPPSGFTAQQWSEELYKMLPRVEPGGSVEGSVLTTQTNSASTTAITPDADRLYASVDEFAFKPLTASNSRTPNNTTVLNKNTLDRARFFLTASSRAPDLNLFNKPRVCIWPLSINTTSSDRSAYDQLMVFCSTINNKIYYFQRQDSLSPIIDLPKIANASTTGLGRNRMLLEYLRSLTNQNIPGFGGNFNAKYGKDNDQILTEIFDYIRSANTRDVNVANKYTVGHGTWNSGIGQVVPIQDQDKGTSGFGRFRTIKGATLLIIANADGDEPNSQPASNPVPAGKIRIQAMFLPQLFDPTIGSVFDIPYFKLVIRNLSNLKWSPDGGGTYTSLFGGGDITLSNNYYPVDNAFYGDQYGVRQAIQPNTSALISAQLDVTKPTVGNQVFSFQGGTVELEIQSWAGDTVQKVSLDFPANPSLPLPSLAPSNVWSYPWDYSQALGPYNMRYFGGAPALAIPNKPSGPDVPNGAGVSINNEPSQGGRLKAPGDGADNCAALFTSYDTVRSVNVASGDVRMTAAQKTPPSTLFQPLGAYSSNTKVAGMHSFWTADGQFYYGAVAGRLVPSANYDYLGTSATYFSNNAMEYSLNKTSIPPTPLPTLPSNQPQPGGKGGPQLGSGGSDVPWNGVAMGKSTQFASGDLLGDFDNAPGICRDGPFINKADEGDSGAAGKYMPYINWRGKTGVGAITTGLFTPNRQIPSAVTLGSLPTGVYANRPWQTLLFRPDPSGKHPGNKDMSGTGTASPGMPADHLYLDLFNMPVVEPYAISEPLSTAGKINMNYQIMPFTYLERSTGIRAVLKQEKTGSIPDSLMIKYKSTPSPNTNTLRLNVNIDETLSQFKKRFNPTAGDNAGDIFRSATEICDLHIVPDDPSDPNASVAGMPAYWNTHRLSGDNLRERIYTTLYPRLTTKSNTFTVHYRVQVLKQGFGPGSSSWATWDESRGQILSEIRGSSVIERYIDPNQSTLPDFATDTSATIDSYYRFRIVSTKKFAP